VLATSYAFSYYRCGVTLNESTITVDRIVPGNGGTYRRFTVLRLQAISSVFAIADTAVMVAPGQPEIGYPNKLDGLTPLRIATAAC